MALGGSILLGASPLPGQEGPRLQDVGIFTSVAQSENVEFPNPRGFGAFASWEFGGEWLFRLSFHRLNEETRKLGRVCMTYSPLFSCVQTMTLTDATISSLRGGLLRLQEWGERFTLGFGGGLSFNDVNARSRGVDGRLADLLAPKTGQVGYLALLSADLVLHRGLPLKLAGGFSNHWVHFHICSGEDPPQHDPFCKISQFREVEIGLAISF